MRPKRSYPFVKRKEFNTFTSTQTSMMWTVFQIKKRRSE